MADLAGRYTQDIGMEANHGDRCHGYRARNLLARPGRSRERVMGSSDKSQRILACRCCPAFAPGGLKRTRAAVAQLRKRLQHPTKVGGDHEVLPRHFCQAFHPQRLRTMSIVTRKDVTAMLGGARGRRRHRNHCDRDDRRGARGSACLARQRRPLPSGRVARVVEIVTAISEEETEEEVAKRS